MSSSTDILNFLIGVRTNSHEENIYPHENQNLFSFMDHYSNRNLEAQATKHSAAVAQRNVPENPVKLNLQEKFEQTINGSFHNQKSVFNPFSCLNYISFSGNKNISQVSSNSSENRNLVSFREQKLRQNLLSKTKKSTSNVNVSNPIHTTVIFPGKTYKNLQENFDLPLEEENNSTQALTRSDTDFLKTTSGILTGTSSPNFSSGDEKLNVLKGRSNKIIVNLEETGHEFVGKINKNNITSNEKLINGRKRTRDIPHNIIEEVATRPKGKPYGKKNKLQKANDLFNDSFLYEATITGQISIPDFAMMEQPTQKENYSEEEFINDLKNIENVYEHEFMKKNFPMMYTQSNYYKNVKVVNDKRVNQRDVMYISREKLLSYKLENNSFLLSECSSDSKNESNSEYNPNSNIKPRKVWSAFNDIKDEHLNDYLLKIQQCWPFQYSNFNHDTALEFLMINNYKVENCLDIVNSEDKLNSEEIKLFFTSKKSDEIKMITTNEGNGNKRQRNYMLRKNPSRNINVLNL
jgi:hypothetical protein